MKKKLQKLFLTDYSLFIVQDLLLLSNLVEKFSEGIHKIKCKYRHDDKKCETSGINSNQ